MTRPVYICLDKLTVTELNALLTGVCSALEHKNKQHAWNRKWKVPAHAVEEVTEGVVETSDDNNDLRTTSS